MILYHIASISKIILGLGILFLTYTSINVYEDPTIGIGLGFIGLFIVIWGLSFYLFRGLQKTFRMHVDNERVMKDSYKLSLLFGIYVMINVGLLLLGTWTKRRGIILLVGFIGLQILLFQPTHTHDSTH